VWSNLLTNEDINKQDSAKDQPKVVFISDHTGNGVSFRKDTQQLDVVASSKSKGYKVPKEPLRSKHALGSVVYKIKKPLDADSSLIYGVGSEAEMGINEHYHATGASIKGYKAYKGAGSVRYEKIVNDKIFYVEPGLKIPFNEQAVKVEATPYGIHKEEKHKKVGDPEPVFSVGVLF
jgi:hypothetical protein